MPVTKTSSTVAVHAGEHLLKVNGHSLLIGSNAFLTSETFRVGDHDWNIRYYPNGDRSIVDDQFTTVFLWLVNINTDEKEVTAQWCFSLKEDPTLPAKGPYTDKFVPDESSSWGVSKFVNKADLAASGCLKDDCLVIKCTVRVITSKLNNDDDDDCEDNDDGIVAPPSDLGRDLGYLLENGLKTDLTVRIGWFRSFEVHACMLAARSPVFWAQLCGAMMESRQSTIRIKDMDAKVFEVLLHYIYNDCLPEFMEETTEVAINMTQHLLVMADRYAIHRLKLICKGKLGKALDVNTVGFTLDLAEQYHCQLLKDYCLKYMVRDSERLRAIVKTSGFKQLKQNHPLIACEILHKVIDKL
ncbi:hypothetical protein CFC21_082454 [Triticum aestivum]|uniref:BTB domain-containing protein n=2 Tax=Triticum aestivum TaxID=4565 RepID=A0A3B6NMP1_WHEAT|nr:BTB/POZ and MATH domain-containing protein 1-like [Triticum aestivum]KAF7077968.1 hypothetical protein CFC21_082454 [Triticum aestivum]